MLSIYLLIATVFKKRQYIIWQRISSVLSDKACCLWVQTTETVRHGKCISEDASALLSHNDAVREGGRKSWIEENKEARLILSQEPSKYLGKTMLESITKKPYCSDLPLSPLQPQAATSRSTRKYLGIVRTEKKSLKYFLSHAVYGNITHFIEIFHNTVFKNGNSSDLSQHVSSISCFFFFLPSLLSLTTAISRHKYTV